MDRSNALHCIIGVPPAEGLGKRAIWLIQILLVAEKIITRTWFKVLAPTLEQRHEGLKKVYLMGKNETSFMMYGPLSLITLVGEIIHNTQIK